MNIIVSGSIAYDRIMDFPGYFSEHILPEKIHVLNVSFTVNGLKERFGGTAGNIAYSLKLMGEDPIIVAAVGKDYHRYFEWLNRHRISTEFIKIIQDDFTSSAYITTDLADNQITGFHPGAMKFTTELNLDSFPSRDTIFIISPGNLEDMLHYSGLCKEKEIDYIFDPGQSLPLFKAADLIECIRGCRLLICNDYELDMILKKTGFSRKDLLNLTETLIVTRGEHGSTINTAEGIVEIAAVKPRRVVDPTGAGDAYRGGLLSGLVHRKNLEQSARMGSTCSSFCVECIGTQEYGFTPSEFAERLRQSDIIKH
jgi:adenosine kinase